jgi:L-threonylcarbamoyladenylate synthase
MPNGAREFGRVLYATLRDLDLRRPSRLLVEMPPPDEAWDAVRDRLQRAAAAGEMEQDAG